MVGIILLGLQEPNQFSYYSIGRFPMHRSIIAALTVCLVVVFGFADSSVAAAPAQQSATTPYLLVGTAKLDRKRIVVSKQRQHPGAVYTYGDCQRLSRSKVHCKYIELRTVQGVRERVTYTVKVRIEFKRDGGTIRYIRESFSGPVEA